MVTVKPKRAKSLNKFYLTWKVEFSFNKQVIFLFSVINQKHLSILRSNKHVEYLSFLIKYLDFFLISHPDLFIYSVR